MDGEQFRIHGKEMVDYICDYMINLGKRRVFPDVRPGYLAPRLPSHAPEEGEDWSAIMRDIEEHIMPGVTHWQHPRFHAYFPAGNAYPSILGDMASAGFGAMASSWACSPGATELEIQVVDWLAGMFDLPDHFRNSSDIGGGVLQGSASESILLSMLAARNLKIEEVSRERPDLETGEILSRLVGYCASLAHCSCEKAGMLSFTRIRQLDIDPVTYALRGHTLAEAIREDKERGLIPFFAECTLGSTACCSFDNLEEMGEVCTKEGVRLHIDSAYGGNAFICPEFRHRLKGADKAFSMNFNPNKWMLINFDCSVMWVANKRDFLSALAVNKEKEDTVGNNLQRYSLDLHHWGIADERRFRALKMWTTIRNYGVEGLQFYIREHTRLAILFDRLVRTDHNFEIIGETSTGLACFRLRGSNAINEWLMRSINEDSRIHIVPASVGHLYILRFALCAESACDDDVFYAWNVVKQCSKPLVRTLRCATHWRCLVRGKQEQRCRQKSNELDVYLKGSVDANANEQSLPSDVSPAEAARIRRQLRLQSRPVARIIIE